MDPSIVLTKNPDAAYRVYDGQATVILPDRAEVSVLNEVGSLVWDRIDGKRSVEEIIAAVLEHYQVNAEQAQRDVFEFISSLRDHGMVFG